ncbi:LacI family transcriptional regulator [Curtobacterium sp. MCPF17_047]|uniref:LacI family DNA-binding transcriptional regulator n=1 Tax=unclassified Curtobacterium TaxID=257496 RepID=UPI000DA748EB|nr:MULTISPECIES: substrate-binding domain-containing protein [unclassified Curtobacterium]PZE54405.1 LacI family transcriptional regulator [Curtobacterium sp. MCPF17_001]PZF64840.1 LacI family transcriptional regulator [Curtobacterium sp. MCPF17_047]
MADVARAAGVSVMTVSYAYSAPHRVSPGTRARVETSAAALGYAGPNPAARSLRQGRSNSIAVVVGEGLTYAFDDPESSRFLAGVASVCVEFQQSLTLVPVNGDARDADRIRESAADAFVLWTGVSDGPLLDAVVASGRRVAIQGAEPDSLRARPDADQVAGRVHVVTIDDRSAAAAVATATFAGAARPAVVSFALEDEQEATVVHGPALDDVRFPGARQRLRGYRDAVEAAGHRWADVPVAVVGRNHRQDARPVIEELLGGADAQESAPDAVVAMSDQLALAVLDVLTETDRSTPGDVAVSGWDDSPEAAQHGLTSVHQALEEQGTQCALLALGQVTEAPTAPWSLALRTTTRPERP